LEDKTNLSILQESWSKYEIETFGEINDLKKTNDEEDKNLNLFLNNLREEKMQLENTQHNWFTEKLDYENNLKNRKIQLETLQAKLTIAYVSNIIKL
jgi:hypothetical protein